MEHGSPLTVEVDGRNIVTGVSSWTLGCGGDGRQYAVYSELAKVDFQTEFKVLRFRLFYGARCEPGLRRVWQLQVVLRLVTQPQVRRPLTKALIPNSTRMELDSHLGKLGRVERVLRELRQEPRAGLSLRRRHGGALLPL